MTISDPVSTGSASDDGWFKTTQWTVVLQAAENSPNGDAALASLCQAYWYPLYTYVRRRGHGPEDAQDLTQEFFARLLAKNYLNGAGPEKGRFRSFLLTALKGFLANEWARANCLKRGGGQQIISLDAEETENRYLAEPMDSSSADRAFDRRWALTILEKVMERLDAEYAAAGKSQLFNELKVFVYGEKGQGSYPESGRRLGMTEGALRVQVHRMRQRYRELLRLEIANTVDSPEAIDDEIRQLFSALAS